MNIKESLELLVAVEIVAVSGIEIAKDGIDFSDLSKVIELVKKSEVITAGVKGLDLIDDEIKDLDQAELMQLGLATFSMIKKIIVATKSEAVV